jgi:hypothetical protein
MNLFKSGRVSAAAQFRRSPKYIAREVTKDWWADHPEWSDDDALFTFEFLLEVYEQARVWWSKHPTASDTELGAAYHEIVKAFMRGEQLFPTPGKKAMPLRGAALRVRQNALWNCNSPAEKAELELNGWLYGEGAKGRRPTAAEKNAKWLELRRKHERQPRTSHPVRAEILGHY